LKIRILQDKGLLGFDQILKSFIIAITAADQFHSLKRDLNYLFSTLKLLLLLLAEVPSAVRVNLQPAGHLMGWGEGAVGHTRIKTFLGQVQICVQNFIKIGAGGWISISPPHTNRQTNLTNKNLYAHFYIYR